MPDNRLKYVSDRVTDLLRDSVGENLERYRNGDFSDLAEEDGWSLSLSIDCAPEGLSGLDPAGTPEAEVANSRLVWEALPGLTAAMACHEGIWVRLTHVEGLEYSRQRWIASRADDVRLQKAVDRHFFAATITKRRDDNAISRLWWNAYIADRMLPGTDLEALPVILGKADIRSNLVERSSTGMRRELGAGIVRALQQYEWLKTGEDNFRSFMMVMNRRGGGYLFEAMSESEVDAFMFSCAQAAGLPEEATAA